MTRSARPTWIWRCVLVSASPDRSADKGTYQAYVVELRNRTETGPTASTPAHGVLKPVRPRSFSAASGETPRCSRWLPLFRLRRWPAGGHGPPHVCRRRSRRRRHPPGVHRGRRAIRHRGIAPAVSWRRARPQRARVRPDDCRMDSAAGAGGPRGCPAAAPVSAAGTAPALNPASRGDKSDRRRAAGTRITPGTAAKPTAAINPARPYDAGFMRPPGGADPAARARQAVS